jgi:hypothetical protein
MAFAMRTGIFIRKARGSQLALLLSPLQNVIDSLFIRIEILNLPYESVYFFWCSRAKSGHGTPESSAEVPKLGSTSFPPTVTVWIVYALTLFGCAFCTRHRARALYYFYQRHRQ